MKSIFYLIITSCGLIFHIFSGCSNNRTNHKDYVAKKKTKIVSKVKSKKDSLLVRGMVLIPSGTFNMGADNNQGFEDEYPKHRVKINPFWIDNWINSEKVDATIIINGNKNKLRANSLIFFVKKTL